MIALALALVALGAVALLLLLLSVLVWSIRAGDLAAAMDDEIIGARYTRRSQGAGPAPPVGPAP